jgi:hypothetical protein
VKTEFICVTFINLIYLVVCLFVWWCLTPGSRVHENMKSHRWVKRVGNGRIVDMGVIPNICLFYLYLFEWTAVQHDFHITKYACRIANRKCMKDRQHNRLKKNEQKANNFDKTLHRKLKLININLLKTGYNHLLRKSKKFLPGPSVSSTNKTERHDIIEILLLKVALSTIKQTSKQLDILD